MKKLFVIITLSGSLAFAAVLTGTPAPEVREYPTTDIEKILVENTSGKVTIVPTTIDKVKISTVKKKFPEKCTLTTEKSEYSEVIVRVERSIGEDCEVDIEMEVPKEADLSVWSGSGDVNIKGIEGNLSFNVGSGSVTADGKFKKVEGKSGSGAVTLNGLTSGGNISVGSGSVNLRYLEFPMGRMDVKTGSGDAVVAFPKNSKINASLDTGSGEISNELGDTDSADFGLNLKTGSGDLKVKAY